jgi:hypothetical protein
MNPEKQFQLFADDKNYLLVCAELREDIRTIAHSLLWSETDLEDFARKMFLCSFVGLSYGELGSMLRYFQEKKKRIAR